jgi:phosphonopyruvate decarboxylase
MGHTCQIALGIALYSKRKVICIDGDGSAIMHMGSMAIVGSGSAHNLVHVVINNGAHDSVGGQPTVGFEIDLVKIAMACGYRKALTAINASEIAAAFEKLSEASGPVFLEIKTKKGAREDLGRPTKSPLENKRSLMQTLGVF